MDAATQLTQAYQTYLGRAPEAGQIQWRLSQSTPIAKQIADIAGSAEANAYRSRSTSSGATSLTDFATSTKNEMQALLDRQKAEQEGMFGQYTNAVNSQEKLPALYTRLQQEAGIPDLSNQLQVFKDQIFGVKNLLDRLDEDVTSRTRGTMTSEAQRRRMVSAEGDDLRNQLGRLGTGMEPVADLLKNASGNVSTMLQLTSAQQDKDLKPLEMQINALSDRFAREITGFTTSKETQLTAIMDKLERDRYLADRDWELAQKLAAEERDYSRQKSLAAASYAAQYQPTSTIGGSAAPTYAPQTTTRSLPSLRVSTAPQQTLSVGQLQPQASISIQGGSTKPLQGGASWSLQGGSGIRLQ